MRSWQAPPTRKVLVVYTAAGLSLFVIGVIGLAGFAESARWRHLSAPRKVVPSAVPTPPPVKTITLSAVGDIIMGVAGAGMPANDGRDFFAKVKHLLTADLVMGNMEEPLTVDTGYVKCRPEQTRCNQFRVPPSYAEHLRDAGFHLLNQANNHGYDYGPKGYTNTQKALEAHGLRHTGARGQITLIDVAGVRVAVLGFSPYPRDNSLIDLAAAKAVVEKAAAQADVVVIQVHWGAEGADRTHVRPGTEYFLGENRGDPIRFSHTVIDAGADLVIGHGPHTLRAMELYRGRLIAYSLGNFAGGRGLKGDGSVFCQTPYRRDKQAPALDPLRGLPGGPRRRSLQRDRAGALARTSCRAYPGLIEPSLHPAAAAGWHLPAGRPAARQVRRGRHRSEAAGGHQLRLRHHRLGARTRPRSDRPSRRRGL